MQKIEQIIIFIIYSSEQSFFHSKIIFCGCRITNFNERMIHFWCSASKLASASTSTRLFFADKQIALSETNIFASTNMTTNAYTKGSFHKRQADRQSNDHILLLFTSTELINKVPWGWWGLVGQALGLILSIWKSCQDLTFLRSANEPSDQRQIIIRIALGLNPSEGKSFSLS